MKKNDNKSMIKGKHRVTIKDVADYTGYSIATVSRVLNKSGIFYSDKTFKIINKAIKELNYHPDAIARGLKTKKTFNIAFLVPWTSEFFSEIFLGIQDAAEEDGYSVAMYSSKCDINQEKRNIDVILSNRLDGIIISTGILDIDNISRLINEQIPFVIIEKFIQNRDIPCISIKNREISKKAVNYLIGLGHKKIGFVSEPITIGKLGSRFRGYKDALKNSNIKFDQSYVLTDELLKKEIFKNSYEYIKKNFIRVKDFTALFFTSDIMAVSAIKALKDGGIKVPEDISIIGFDGLEISKYISPSLTTVVQPRYEMGYKAMKFLLKLLNGEIVKSIELKAHLLVGESTMPVK